MIRKFMRWFFRLLYHPFAWGYDAVAWTVSAGRWVGWVQSAATLVEGPNVLELGHGPGHLQARLMEMGLRVFGLDESRQMGRLARQRIRQHGFEPRLTRSDARAQPFPAGHFQTIVSTFPSEYIIQPGTLNEIRRVLVPGGRLVVLASTVFTGPGLFDRSLALLFRLTGQSAPFGAEFDPLEPFQKAGLKANLQWVTAKNSKLLFIIAEKSLPE